MKGWGVGENEQKVNKKEPTHGYDNRVMTARVRRVGEGGRGTLGGISGDAERLDLG